MNLVTFAIITISVIIVLFSASPLSLQQLPLQYVFAQDDESQTGIEQRLGQKNLGSGESTNFNCADNTIEGSPSSLSLCQTVEPSEEEPPQEESATLFVCKEVDFSSPVDFSFTVTGNGPEPDELLLGDGDCVDVTIGPGGYTVTENNPSPFTFITGNCLRDPNNSRSATGEIQAGETQECNFRNGTD